MTTYVGATEAAGLLGVTKATLYAYVSRGIVGRLAAADGRTSLFAREEVERLAARGRTRRDRPTPTIDVQIGSSITDVHEEGVSYRGHDVVELSRTCTFEQVAELLWTASLPAAPPAWSSDAGALTAVRQAVDAACVGHPVRRLALAATVLAEVRPDDDAASAARHLLMIAPSVLGGPRRGDVATRLASAWRRRPTPQLVGAVSQALVLLADHELATSTLAVRVACSVRAGPYEAIATGLHVVGGALHGGASAMVAAMLDDAAEDGGPAAVARRLGAGQRLPGFGHSVYRQRDPRMQPLLDAVRQLSDPVRLNVVDAVLAEAGRRIVRQPNIDFALGALMFVGRLPRDCPIFAVARIAGWAAHYDEELAERPVRYRGLSVRR